MILNQLRRLRSKGPSALALILGTTLLAPTAAAQNFSGEVSAQRFDPAPGAGNFLTTRSVRTQGAMNWTAGLMANYGYRALKIKTAPSNAQPAVYDLVENMVTADVLGSLTIMPQLQLGIKVPVTWVKGPGVPPQNGQPDPLVAPINAFGVGDLQIEAKGRFYGTESSPVALGAYVFVGAPLGNLTAKGSYIGNSSISGGGALVGDFLVGQLGASVNVGGIIREAAVLGSALIGPELRFSGALGYQVGPVIKVMADVFGNTNFGPAGTTGIEGVLGARITPLGSQLSVTAGAGGGLLRGIGTPEIRATLGVLYDATVLDKDKDSMPDNTDACPDDAEDRDNYEDSDGCPELDNDDDALPDSVDKCPNQEEDVDQFEDQDGCPDPDNDKDGIEDVSDHCPAEPETKNGVDDMDGCPDVKDTDGDNILDEADKCPEEPEDTDGFEDTDGCKDPDNDGDTIPDDQDECIDLPEDGKGKGPATKDGCPVDA